MVPLKGETLRVLVLNADYPNFLEWFYLRQLHLQTASYAEQMMARHASLFGLADFYSKNISALGHVSADVYVNNWWMQAAWAREHGIALETGPARASLVRSAIPHWMERAVAPLKPVLRPLARKVGLSPRLDAQSEQILLAQVEEFRPDLVLNQDVFYVNSSLASRIKQIGHPLLVGQVGVAPSPGENWSAYDLIVSQLRSIVNFFLDRQVRAELIHLAFEPSILERLPASGMPTHDVTFVGSLSANHLARTALLEAVADRYDLKLYGAGLHALPSSSPLHRCYQGEVWGVEMYQALRASRVTLNSHIDMARREAGNMRLFEATGVGTLLLTDDKDNLQELFQPNREVVVWKSVEDCLLQIQGVLDDDDRRQAIARSGQARTLAEHTYRHRVQRLLRSTSTLR